MDLSFSPAECAFREEVRDFIAQRLAPDVRTKLEAFRPTSKDDLVTWQRTLNERGWAAPSWPKEWGGPGWSPVQRYIFLDELHQAPAPEPLSFNVAMLGPILIAFGTDEQKRRFLPRAANLDDWWCQGFSEPDAGSDLASLRTTAKRSGDHYVVNGQKMWQGMAQHADWMFTLVRTNPDAPKKQAGISFLLIDMKSPGVTVTPIRTIDGRHEVNSVFLDNVEVPIENLVGEENNGWTCAKHLLSNERSNIARIGLTKRIVRVAKTKAAELDRGARRRTLERLAALEAEIQALEITQLRVLTAPSTGGVDARPSILKLKGTELRQRAAEILTHILGPTVFEAVPEDVDAFDGVDAAASHFTLRAASIYGGSSEVQKNIIAKSMLRS